MADPTSEELLLALLKKLLGGAAQQLPPINVNVTIDTEKMAAKIVQAIEGPHGSRTAQIAPR